MTSMMKFASLLQRFPYIMEKTLEESLQDFTREDLYVFSKNIRRKCKQKVLTEFLFSTSKSGHWKTAELLLLAGANLESRWWTSPLFDACEKGNCRLIYVLLRYGADPNKRIATGFDRSLNRFCNGKIDDPNVVRSFLDAGAEIDKDTIVGTPIYCAVKACNWKIADYLVERGADLTEPPYLFSTTLDNCQNLDFVQKLLEHGASVEPIRLYEKRYPTFVSFLKKHRVIYLEGVLDILLEYLIKDLSYMVTDYIL